MARTVLTIPQFYAMLARMQAHPAWWAYTPQRYNMAVYMATIGYTHRCLCTSCRMQWVHGLRTATSSQLYHMRTYKAWV